MKAAVRRTMLALENRTKPLQKIKRYQTKQWEANFTSTGGIYGKWPPHSPNTRGAKKLLYRTGNMFASIKDQQNKGMVSSDGIFWSFTNPGPRSPNGSWPLVHHFGADIVQPRMNRTISIPARKIWDFNQSDADNAGRIMDQWVEEVVRTHFG